MPKRVKHNRISIVRRSSRALLEDWLNLESDELLRRHPEILREPRKYEKEQERVRLEMTDIRWALQEAWESKTLHERVWYISEAQRLYNELETLFRVGTISEDTAVKSAPDPKEPFHKAIFNLYATNAIQRLSICAEGDDCPAMYFIRRKPRKQACCSVACRVSKTQRDKRESKRRERAKEKTHAQKA
jgi:hypothetical protein